MTRPSTFLHPTADLRRSATESKRDRNHKAKWAHGTRPLPGQKNELPGRVRPDGLDSNHPDKTAHGHTVPEKLNLSIRDDAYEAMLDRRKESIDWDVSHDGPEIDARVCYSFDGCGPVQGDQILGAALSQAVEKFEHKETEKLVREYEFVPREDPSEYDHGYTVDGDFEIIERRRQ